jgi:hypothetical protein
MAEEIQIFEYTKNGIKMVSPSKMWARWSHRNRRYTRPMDTPHNIFKGKIKLP